jgi:alkanesulfonate monooxygenase SsuD/methylene tetrahydromethanopterin reductase-like flavin-dependent oxidoreductase (luciferase family)
LGAQNANRPTPPLVAHATVALSTDIEAVRAGARKAISGYVRLPFYANMFAAAGFPVQDGKLSDALLDALVISGEAEAVTARLHELLDSGLDELLLTHVDMGDEAEERTSLFGLVGQL